MFQKLVSHNADLQQLVDKGYAIAIDDSNYLVVRDIPYLRADGCLAWGAIVTKLVFIDDARVCQDDHQIFFAGEAPYGLDGRPIPNLGGGPTSLELSASSEDVVIQRSFSNKPRVTGRFSDFFEKIESYVGIISGPAIEAHGAHPYTYRIKDDAPAPSVFKFRDTLTSRAEITDLSRKFMDEVVAVIGLGGTGGYLLDFLVKTPVTEVRGFDADDFYVHNAFRAPGHLDPQELGKPKADVHRARYENFRSGLRIEKKYITLESSTELDGVTFAFVCVDSGPARAEIFDLLISKNIPFIDVGMGLSRKRGALSGMVRMTYVAPGDPLGLRDKGLAEMSERPENLYRANIQIGELNALNACLAVIRYKQLRGFYIEVGAPYHLLFDLPDLTTVGESDDED